MLQRTEKFFSTDHSDLAPAGIGDPEDVDLRSIGLLAFVGWLALIGAE